MPRVNQEIAGLLVDVVFPHGVAVEADSRHPQRGRAAFARDAILATQGYRTLRFTDRQTENAPAVVAAALNAALTACAA